MVHFTKPPQRWRWGGKAASGDGHIVQTSKVKGRIAIRRRRIDPLRGDLALQGLGLLEGRGD
jgi:hypothetical protein